MLNFNNFEYRKDKIPSLPDERKIFMQELREKFLSEIKQSNIYAEYLRKYESDSVETFISHYVDKKLNLIEESEYLLGLREQSDEEGFLQSAREVLNYILQKKLFNMQLQWRANTINIPGIRNSFDFGFWEKNIEYCPFISPVTPQEIDVMKSFLRKNYFSGFKDWMFWQFYGFLVEKDENGHYPNMPEWYGYYDEIMCTGSLLNMQDIRGEKEEFYIETAKAADAKASEKKIKDAGTYKPSVYAHGLEILDFARGYEKDACFRELFRIWEKDVYPECCDKTYDSFKTECAIKILSNADRPVLIESGMVWHKAVIHCAERYITDRVLEVLDSVYDEYITVTNLGISKRFTPEDLEKEYDKSMFQHCSEMILKGRELCGEPRNFDF
ncbi:MAG TPA: hypothetical protein VHO72_13630 [Bacteroidales bacterium]|nr:hypothetical protein [Bacteroidales bacterium]